MALQTQLIDIPLGGGVEQHKTRELVDPPGVVEVVDMDPSKAGGYVQRRAPYGRVPLATSSLIERVDDDVIVMGVRQTNLQHYVRHVSSESMLTYLDTAGNLEVGAWSAKHTPAGAPFADGTAVLSGTYAGGYTATCITPFGGDDAVVVVVDSGGALISRATMVDSYHVEMVSDGTDIYAFWLSTAVTTTLYARKFTVSSRSWGSRTTVTGHGLDETYGPMSAAYSSSIGFVLVGTTAAPRMAVAAINTSLSVIATQTGGYAAGSTSFAVYVDGTSISVVGADEAISAYHHDMVFESFTFSAPSTISRVANTTYAWKTALSDIKRVTIAGGPSSDSVYVIVQADDTVDPPIDSFWARVTVATGSWGTATYSKDLFLAHRGGPYGVFGIVLRGDVSDTASVNDSVIATVRIDTDNHLSVLARSLPGTLDVALPASGYLEARVPPFFATSTGSYAFPAAKRIHSEVTTGGRVGYDLASVTVSLSPRSFRSASASGTAYIAGGVVSVYDGEDFTDAGFASAPYVYSLTGSVGSGTLTDGVYLVKATWEWVDRNGNVHESMPCVAETITLSGGGSAQKITAVVVPTAYSPRSNDPKLVIYMTDVGGSIFYRRTEIEAPNLHECALLAGDRINVTFGTSSDTSYGVVRALYTDGSELEHWPPPPSDEVVFHANRLWTINGEDGSIWPSLLIVDGIGAAWHPSLAIANSRKDRPVALASIGDRIAVFYPNEIGVIYGDGPDNTGGGGSFSPIAIIHHGVGAKSREVSPTSMGTVFQSAQGLMVMDQGGGLAPFPQIENTIRVLGVADELLVGAVDSPADVGVITAWSNGDVWLYSQRAQSWVKSSVACDTAQQYDAPGRCATFGGDALVSGGDAEAGSGVFQFSRTLGSFEDCSLTTAWIKLAGLQGFQRIRRAWLMVDTPGETAFTVYVRYDYVDTNVETFTFDAGADLESLQGYPVCSIPLRLGRQRCEAIAFKIVSDTTGPNDPVRIIGLRLEVGTLGRQRKNVAPAATG
jgi:hypothetical protein